MKLYDYLQLLDNADIEHEVKATGHPDYVSVFLHLTHPEGLLSLGRATIYQGEYKHTKWYGGTSGDFITAYNQAIHKPTYAELVTFISDLNNHNSYWWQEAYDMSERATALCERLGVPHRELS